jgi:hypothetical protein
MRKAWTCSSWYMQVEQLEKAKRTLDRKLDRLMEQYAESERELLEARANVKVATSLQVHTWFPDVFSPSFFVNSGFCFFLRSKEKMVSFCSMTREERQTSRRSCVQRVLGHQRTPSFLHVPALPHINLLYRTSLPPTGDSMTPEERTIQPFLHIFLALKGPNHWQNIMRKKTLYLHYKLSMLT